MNRISFTLLFALILPAGLCAGSQCLAAPQDPNTILMGYAVATVTSGAASDLQVIQTFGLRQGSFSVQSGGLAPQLTTSGLLFVSTSDRLSRDLGLAIANPGNTEARIAVTLRRDDGITIGSKTLFLPARWQIAQFVTQLLSTQFQLPKQITGTLSIVSDTPVAIVALRFRGSAFSMEAVTQLSAPSAVPPILPGIGGQSGLLLPNFVQGGGWATEITLINTGRFDAIVRLDFFTPRGDPLTARLNGTSGSTFLNLVVRAGGVLVIAPLDSSGNSQF